MESGSILVTGASGYIGTHLLVALAGAGYACIPLDNFSNSSPEAVVRAQQLTRDAEPFRIVKADIRDRGALASLLSTTNVIGVVHLAGLKSVAESNADPLAYYDNNVGGTIALLEELKGAGVRLFVFSSSATVYSQAGTTPYVESSPLGPLSPYGRTKLMIEQMLDDLAASDSSWRIAKLRYFNPIGAHPSGLIGECPKGTPNNLMPIICDVAAGHGELLRIFGNDYSTVDGTCVRDYIHVMDLVEGHIAAIKALQSSAPGTVLTANLGTGRATSVMELVETFERANGVTIPWKIVGRREGDIAVSCADCTQAREKLRWATTRNLEDMCRDAWAWKVKYPYGF